MLMDFETPFDVSNFHACMYRFMQRMVECNSSVALDVQYIIAPDSPLFLIRTIFCCLDHRDDLPLYLFKWSHDNEAQACWRLSESYVMMKLYCIVMHTFQFNYKYYIFVLYQRQLVFRSWFIINVHFLIFLLNKPPLAFRALHIIVIMTPKLDP